MANETILSITSLIKEYDSLRAVDQISFVVNQGEIVGLLGPNGAGKTTTINMILDILEPTDGSIEILGRNLRTYADQTSANISISRPFTPICLLISLFGRTCMSLADCMR